ncbi:histidine phosphatase family protein [Litorihabitans aurantiacus]|uniref:Histidine phosphatase family protein n=1 Tax=Litorihabitans aurantiacus TaxID=1930061 RepID=A0AA38CWM0_9MICO|nr:histidine phosphatase family protein [Litorihabitans aurantiacus]GMA33267.1 hypothetical protein GCM10025875_32590 [Litorihabitans aurantiacus]
MDTTQVAPTTTTPTTTTLTLVRHGQTHLNARRVMQGACDSPLTRTGRAGVLVTAQHLSTQAFDAAYSSPQGRAVMTAVEIVRHHDELPLRSVAGLREFSFGRYERRPERELDEIEPWAVFVPRVLAGEHPGLPGGESGADFMDRVRTTFARIVEAHPGARARRRARAHAGGLPRDHRPERARAAAERVGLARRGDARGGQRGVDLADPRGRGRRRGARFAVGAPGARAGRGAATRRLRDAARRLTAAPRSGVSARSG